MIDYCPNCGNKEVEKISDNSIYCKPCDQTFVITAGKATVEKKGRFDGIDERLNKIEDNNLKIAKDLYGGESAIPFLD